MTQKSEFRAFATELSPVIPFENTGFDACEKYTRLKRANSVYEYVEFKLHQAKDADKKYLELERGVLNKIFQNDVEGQKLLQSLLVRVDSSYKKRKVIKGKLVQQGQCIRYSLHEVNWSKFEQNLYEGVLKFDVNREKLPTTVKKYLNKLDKQNRQKLLEDKRKRELTERRERGICYTDLSTQPKEIKWGLLWDKEFLSLPVKDQRNLTIKYARYKAVLDGSQEMEYNERTYRLWSGLQNIKKDLKPLFYKYTIHLNNFDISNAATTILLGYVESRMHLNTQVEFPSIHYYLNNKDEIRSQVMSMFNLDYDQAKNVLMHLTNKGYISKSDKCKWLTITNDPFGRRLAKLRREGHFLLKFYDEIKRMWKLARKVQLQEFEAGKIPVNPKEEHRFNLYFYLERQILEVIKAKLKSANINFLTEHDGFRTDKEIDVTEYEQEVFNQLQIKIKIEQ